MRNFTVILMVIVCAANLLSQDKPKEPDPLFYKYINASLEKSNVYIFGGNFNLFNKAGHNYDQIVEGKLVPVYYFYDTKRSSLNFTPKVVLRMFMTESSPVRTPSFMPRFTFNIKLNKRKKDWYEWVSLMYSHYSNGATGNFIENSAINDTTGSFSTNYFEIAYHSFKNGWYFKAGLEQHAKFNFAEELYMEDYRYGSTRINLVARYSMETKRISKEYTGNPLSKTVQSVKHLIKARGLHQWEIELTLIPAKVMGSKKYSRKNFALSASRYYKPAKIDDFSVILNYYYGPDYYNLSYHRHINTLRIGFSVDPYDIFK